MSKADRVLRELRKHRKLTAQQIIALTRCTNPADLVYKLRVRGHEVQMLLRRSGSRSWAEYRL